MLTEKLKLSPRRQQIYYEIGKEMAYQYIDTGREAGNVLMDKFDPEAAKLTEILPSRIGI